MKNLHFVELDLLLCARQSGQSHNREKEGNKDGNTDSSLKREGDQSRVYAAGERGNPEHKPEQQSKAASL